VSLPKSESLEVDLAAVTQTLERIRPQISPEDHRCLSEAAEALVELTRLIRNRNTTIARLRRMLEWSNSEKTADVCGASSSSEAGVPAQSPEPKTPAAGDPCAPGDGDSGSPERDARSTRPAPGHGRIPASAYPRAHPVTVAHETLHVGDTCPDCSHGKLHRLPMPARSVRIFGQAPLVATCWECERLRCGGCGQVFTARAPAPAQGPKYSEGAAAMLALLRYGTGLPLHRLAGLQRHLQTPVPASTQWEVVRDRAKALEPVYAELVRRAAAGRVLHNDDTHARILEWMGQRRAEQLAAGELSDPERTGLFTTGVVSQTDRGPIALFFTGRKHAGENLTALLAERDALLGPPIQMCDGLARNLPREHTVVLGNCLAHGRRHIVDEVENFPAECRHVLEALRRVFHTEARCRPLGLTAEQRLELHQQKSGPVMEALRCWMEAQFEHKRVEPNSGLGQAFRYLLQRWEPLTLFLRVSGAPLDNHLCERALKMAIRHRNNSLFYRTQRGAGVGDRYMSLIYTADLHGENAFEYLTALFEHEDELAGDPAAWLPWTYRDTLAAPATQPAA
jgi:transposase